MRYKVLSVQAKQTDSTMNVFKAIYRVDRNLRILILFFLCMALSCTLSLILPFGSPVLAITMLLAIPGAYFILLPEVLVYRSTLHINSKKYDSAKRLLARSLALSERNPLVYINLGYLNMLEGEFAQAQADIAIAIEQNPKSSIAYLNQAAAAYYSGDYRATIDSSRKALQLNNSDKRANLNILVSHYMRGDYQIVLELTENPASFKQHRESVLLIKLFALLACGKLNTAESYWAKTSCRYPDTKKIGSAAIASSRENYSEAISMLTDIRPGQLIDGTGHIVRSIALSALGEPGLAYSTISSNFERKLDHLSNFIVVSCIYHDCMMAKEGLDLLNKIEGSYSQSISLQTQLALLYIRENDFEKALSITSKVLENSPDHSQAINIHTIGLARTGHLEDANKWHNRQLAQEAQFSLTQHAEIHIKWACGKLDEALNAAERLLQHDPNDLWSLKLKADLLDLFDDQSKRNLAKDIREQLSLLSMDRRKELQESMEKLPIEQLEDLPLLPG